MINETIQIDGGVLKTYVWEDSAELGVLTRPAVLILPGGAYMMCSDREAEPVALAYAAEGFNAFVLRYSVNSGFEKPFQEAQKAVSIIRENASKWHIRKNSVAACGFSAGGHLACSLGTLSADKVNAMILGYPAVIGETWKKLDATIPDLVEKVTEKTSPSFIFSCYDDTMVSVRSSLSLANKLCDCSIPFECHIYEKGGHGFSVAKKLSAAGNEDMENQHVASWFPMSVKWLKDTIGDVEIREIATLPTDVSPVLYKTYGELISNDRTKTVMLRYSKAFLAPQLEKFGCDASLASFITQIGLTSDEIKSLSYDLEKVLL